ncbi:MAG: hypothetical protein M9928_09370 [Anaerolineae bacterium]|nr:hypothetical protein [Anaerolineae bacterium]MCO5192915.1 hypothetical protein [Anaerolineae bacterium]MCO5198320.1 hypothetical protein [Anaerolineae bacterium]MCO5205230.1 hypothetical protein [Anaerolineae bacterium]
MSTNQPTQSQWQTLYAAAKAVQELAPWQWMTEVDLFGIEHPVTGELGFVSVMGQLGEHLAIAVYIGADGLSGFTRLLELGPMMTAEDVLLTPQLQASFENRSEITKRDYEVIKSLGLKFRGRQAWPQFRSHKPGYEPWYVNAAEARFLQIALEQLLHVADRYAEDEDYPPEFPGEKLLFRVPEANKEGVIVWRDEIRPIPEPVAMPVTTTIDRDLLTYIDSCPRVGNEFELGFSIMLGTIIGDRGQRGYTPFNLIMVEGESGYILGANLFTAKPTIIDMWAQIPQTFLQFLSHHNVVPAAVYTHQPMIYDLLQGVTQELKIELVLTPDVPALRNAMDALAQFSM